MHLEWISKTAARIFQRKSVWYITASKRSGYQISAEGVTLKAAIQAFNIKCVEYAEEIDASLPKFYACDACEAHCRVQMHLIDTPKNCIRNENHRWVKQSKESAR